MINPVQALETLKSHSKLVVGIVLGLLLAFAGGYGTAKFTSPAKIIEKSKTVEVQKQVVDTATQSQSSTVTKAVSQSEKTSTDTKDIDVLHYVHAHVVVVTEKTPAGNVKITRTIDYDNDTQTKKDIRNEDTSQNKGTVQSASQADLNSQAHSVLENTKTVETSKLVLNSQPDWQIGLTGGLNVGNIFHNKISLTDMDFGLNLQRRMIGPLWLGVYGNRSGEAGLAISIQF